MEKKISYYYLALLRGINVGGNNLIKMTDLKAAFLNMNFKNVSTYIQSGNVIFYSTLRDKTQIKDTIEKNLNILFGYPGEVLVISAEELEKVMLKAPKHFGSKPEEFRYDVMFLLDPLTPEETLSSLKLRDGVDEAFTGPGVVYFSRLISRAGQSYLSKVISLPIYKRMTIRNWNTTSKLYFLTKQ